VIEPISHPEGEHQEVWVVGQPNSAQIGGETVEFPPYRFRWTDELARKHYDVDTALEAAQAFVNYRQEDVTGPWDEGPRILVRTVTCGPWEEVGL
jgi:hypothetical protein